MTARTELLRRSPPEALPDGGPRVLCAVSGGVDSMCLLFMLDAWCKERGSRLIAAHFNHQIRGEAADRDEAFVRDVCRRWGIPLTVGRGDVPSFARREGLSLEEAARTLRYAFLHQAAETEGCHCICTAHHADDNAETVLLNLIRGTGLKGLAGMEGRRELVRRPLLHVTRAELQDYAAVWNIPYVEDETNADPAAAARNLLRLQVTPLLRQLNPRAVEHINQTAAQLRTADRALEEDAFARIACAEVRKGRAALPTDALIQAPEAVRPRMLLQLLDLLGVGRKDIGAVHLNAVLDLTRRAAQGREGRISLPHNITARCCRRQLVLESRPRPIPAIRLIPEKPLRWGGYTLLLLDRREGEGLALRPCRPGECPAVTVAPCAPGARLTLPGARGGRSIKRLCLDRRISPEERDGLPAVYAGGRLAAVWRLGVDTEFLPEGAPVRFIKIIRQREADGA